MSQRLFANLGSATLAEQQRALQRQQQAYESPALQRRGGVLAQALGQRRGEARQRRTEEARARLILESQDQARTQMAEQGPVDAELADIEGMVIASARAASQGNSRLALELQQMARQMTQARQERQLAMGKTESEIIENRATAAAALNPPGTPSEITRNQREIDNLLVRYNNATNDQTRQLMANRIDILRERNQTLAENRQTINDLSARTQGDLEGRIVNAQDNLVRLTDARSAFTDDLLEFGPRLDLAVGAFADKLGNASPEQRQALTDWNTLAQPIYQVVNQTLHELSGAAVTQQELKRQRQNLPNPGTLSNPLSGDTPTMFRNKLDNHIAWTQAAIDRYTYLLESGLVPEGGQISDELAMEHPIEAYLPNPSPDRNSGNSGRFHL
jgi:hypothetical protein